MGSRGSYRSGFIVSIKSQVIRKKAQEYVRKRDWPSAIKEYKRLVELEHNNPNVFNELGDLHLKANQKGEAFTSYEKAIESYQRVNLYNNAIAVCKKILRLNPNHLNVFFTLGQLRKAQGITREAVSYFVSYIDRVSADPTVDHETQKKKLLTIADEMPTHPEVLEKASQVLTEWEFGIEAGTVLAKLRNVYAKLGFKDKGDEVARRMESLGCKPPVDDPSEVAMPEPVASSEENLWDSKPPSPGERIPTGNDGSREPARVPPAAAKHAGDYGNLELGEERAAQPDSVSIDVMDAQDPDQDPSGKGGQSSHSGGGELLTDPARLCEDETDAPVDSPDDEDTERRDDSSTIIVSKTEGPGAVVHVSKIIDEFRDEVHDAIETDDYHTHYDLGMAYLEMDLHSEAVREFQLAAKSSEFQVSSLEMIGLCFIKQNQPRLAIKQLEKGLAMVGNNGRDSLGLLYTLGIAFEMTGDTVKAKEYFEDVYVVDVSFRNVSEKIEKYS